MFGSIKTDRIAMSVFGINLILCSIICPEESFTAS